MGPLFSIWTHWTLRRSPAPERISAERAQMREKTSNWSKIDKIAHTQNKLKVTQSDPKLVSMYAHLLFPHFETPTFLCGWWLVCTTNVEKLRMKGWGRLQIDKGQTQKAMNKSHSNIYFIYILSCFYDFILIKLRDQNKKWQSKINSKGEGLATNAGAQSMIFEYQYNWIIQASPCVLVPRTLKPFPQFIVEVSQEWRATPPL